jgi:hypothetical protein
MKKLHLTTGKDEFRIAQQYIQVKDGFAYCTNSHVFVKIPLSEIFGNESELNTQSNHFYIKASDWQKQCFYP